MIDSGSQDLYRKIIMGNEKSTDLPSEIYCLLFVGGRDAWINE